MPDTCAISNIYFFEDEGNPTLTSPNTPYQLPFYQTRATLNNPELYEDFIKNTITRFRHSKTYKNVKAFLYDIGLDHSQIHGNISSEMANLEMHHNILTVFDIAFVITEWFLNTTGRVCTFDVITMLKDVHKRHLVSLIMLDETTHEEYHDDPMFWIDPKMCTPGWFEFLCEFHQGITKNIAFKIINYLDEAAKMEDKTTDDNDILAIREHVLNWSQYNDCVYYN